MTAKKRAIAPLAIGIIAGLGIGAAIAYGIIRQRQPLASELPFAASFVPQDAIATLSLTTDERQWSTLQRYGNAESQAQLRKTLTQWRDRLLTANSLTYSEHIRPWIGEEITLAFLDFKPENAADLNSPSPAGNALQQQTPVLLVPIANPEVAQETFANLSKPEGQPYGGIPIHSIRGGGGVFYFAVINPQTIAVSTDQQAVKRVIDTAKGEPAVIDTDGYGQAFKQVLEDAPFARIYVNAPVAKEAAIATSINAIPFWGITPIQHNQGMAMSATLQPQGVRIDGVNWLPANSPVQYKSVSLDAALPAQLPADTLLMVTGADVKQIWQGYGQQADADAGSLASPNMLQQGIRNLTGLDPEADFFSWMSGEFAFAVTPSPTTGAATLAPTVTLIAQTSDRAAAEASLAKLDKVMAERYRYSVTDTPTGEQALIKWISPFGSLSAQRGWKNETTTFLTIGPDAADAPTPQATLSEFEPYQTATTTDLGNVNGIFYADVSRLKRDGSGLPVLGAPPDLEPYLNAIQALGVTTAIQGDRSTRFELNVIIPSDSSSPTP